MTLASCDNDLPVELEALILTVRDKYSYLYAITTKSQNETGSRCDRTGSLFPVASKKERCLSSALFVVYILPYFSIRFS